MKIEFSSSGVVMAKDQTLRLPAAAGVRIASQRGTVWITQDGDPRDIVLSAGESVVLERTTSTIVQAIEPAQITMADPVKASRRESAVGLIAQVRLAVERLVGTPAWA